jgi:hypothetical protein
MQCTLTPKHAAIPSGRALDGGLHELGRPPTGPAIARRTGVGATVRPHGLRHQSITRAPDLGRDLRDVAKFSWHRDIRTPAIYDDSRRDVGGEIAKMLGEVSRFGTAALPRPIQVDAGNPVVSVCDGVDRGLSVVLGAETSPPLRLDIFETWVAKTTTEQ